MSEVDRLVGVPSYRQPDSLLVRADRSENCPAVDVKDLDQAALVSRHAELSVRPDLTARCRLFEARNSFDHSVRLGRVDL